MSNPLPPPNIEAEGDHLIRMHVGFDVSTDAILTATTSGEARTLAALSLRIAMESPNLAVAALIGAALESAATGHPEHAHLGLEAAVHLLAGITASRQLGIVE